MNKLAITLTIVAAALLAMPATSSANLLSESDIKRVVDQNGQEIRRCYERHAQRQRSATGRVDLSFVVERDGDVRADSIEVEAPGVRGRAFSRCVERSVSDWKFPSARHPTGVEYPFHFHHTQARGAGPRRR
jgi:outer membrane biosynthesis protein TonB